MEAAARGSFQPDTNGSASSGGLRLQAGDEEARRHAAAREEESYQKALARATRLVNFRERSAAELLGRLKGDGYDDTIARRAVARLQELVGTASGPSCVGSVSRASLGSTPHAAGRPAPTPAPSPS